MHFELLLENCAKAYLGKTYLLLMRIKLNYHDPIQLAVKFLDFYGYGDRYFTLLV